MEQAEIGALHGRAEAELMKIPGVAGVGFGAKEVGGKATDRVALRVYVFEKKPKEAVPAAELVPPSFEGIPTDVLTVRSGVPTHCQDMGKHRPLVAGVSITNFRPRASGGYEVGTLGFFATIDGSNPRKNVVLVSNNHVLAANGASKGMNIYQPPHKQQGNNVLVVDDSYAKKDDIAEIHKVGKRENIPYVYAEDPPVSGQPDPLYYVDCASAKLDISVSSRCNTNCGVRYRNFVDRLDIADGRITGFTRLRTEDVFEADGTLKPYPVYKVGRRTGKTVGTVIDPFSRMRVDGNIAERVIEVEITGVDCEGERRFSDLGDSGAALLNGDRKIVGLLYAKSQADSARAFACHIHPVLKVLSVTPVSLANPPVPPAGQARLDRPGAIGPDRDTAILLRKRFRETRRGADLYAQLVEHSDEVMELVNRCRPVTVAWHRGKGPAFLNRVIANARDPTQRIPREVEETTRSALLRRMADALRRHGGDGLRAAIAVHQDELFGLAEEFDDLRDLADRFEFEARAEKQEVPCGAG